jgi:hypothetical protein
MLTAKLKLFRMDQDFKLLEKREQPCHSFTRNFINLLYIQVADVQNGSPYACIDIANQSRNLDNVETSNDYRYVKTQMHVGSPGGSCMILGRASTGSVPYTTAQQILSGEKAGIQVGTGNNAVTPSDYALQTRIVHGGGVGQLEIGGCEFMNLVIANPNASFDIRRFFTNRAGGSLTINECGIYALCAANGSAGGFVWPFCIARDLVTPGITVNNGEILRVIYNLQITV